MRLASRFGTFLVPDCRAEYGRAYFGIPDLGEECVLDGEDYEEIKDMNLTYIKTPKGAEIRMHFRLQGGMHLETRQALIMD